MTENNSLGALRRYTFGNVELTTTRKSRKFLVSAAAHIRKATSLRGYSLLRDLISSDDQVQHTGSLLLLPSQNAAHLTDAWIGVQHMRARTMEFDQMGNVLAVYTVKLLGSKGVPVFIKDKRLSSSRVMEDSEIVDAQRQRKYVRVPELVARINLPNRQITITKVIPNVNPAHRLAQQGIPLKLLEKVRRKIASISTALIEARLYPNNSKAEHFLVSSDFKRYYLVDNAVGFSPNIRNQVCLLRVLSKNKLPIDLDWDEVVQKDEKFRTFFNGLPEKIRKDIQVEQSALVDEEITNGKIVDKDSLKLELAKLVSHLFPQSHQASRLSKRLIRP